MQLTSCFDTMHEARCAAGTEAAAYARVLVTAALQSLLLLPFCTPCLSAARDQNPAPVHAPAHHPAVRGGGDEQRHLRSHGVRQGEPAATSAAAALLKSSAVDASAGPLPLLTIQQASAGLLRLAEPGVGACLRPALLLTLLERVWRRRRHGCDRTLGEPLCCCACRLALQAGELFDYIVEKGRLLEDEARHFFQQVGGRLRCCSCRCRRRLAADAAAAAADAAVAVAAAAAALAAAAATAAWLLHHDVELCANLRLFCKPRCLAADGRGDLARAPLCRSFRVWSTATATWWFTAT